MDERTGTTPQHLDERFRRALDSILDLVVVERAIRDASGQIVDFEIEWMNNAPVDVAGRSRDELIGRRISALYPALAGGELIAGYRGVVESGVPLVVDVLPYEDVIDGRKVSGYYTVQATKFEDGVLVASRDITPLETSRRELEVALRELEAAQRLAQLGIWRVDLVTGRVFVSEELRRMYDVRARGGTDLEFASLSKWIYPEDRERVLAAYNNAFSVREPVVVEHRVAKSAGSIGYVRSYVQPLVEGDEVVGLWGTTQDLTERVANRTAFEAEHGRRVAAEAIADVAGVLSGAQTRQQVADAVFATMEHFGDVAVVALGLVETDGAILAEHFGGPSIPGEVIARYRRTPLAVDTPMTRAVNTDSPVLLLDRASQTAAFPALVRDFQAVGFQSLVVLPLRRATGVVFGALAIGFVKPTYIGEAEFLALVSEIALVCARTTERLELLDLERSVAQTLQHGLLALDVQSTAAIVRARYRPADVSLEIGGDWYDAVDLGEGRLAVAVGDVVGRGLAAAATMGQLRAALGITALQATDAAHAIRILDGYAQRLPGAQCATVAFAVVDTSRQVVTYSCAGHPPPLLVTPDGDATFLEGATSWPLSIGFEKSRPPAATAALVPGSLLLLYTDGLIERRGEHLDVGLERLRSVVSAHWQLPLRALKNEIFRALVDAEAGDDIALVALRTVGSTECVFADAFRARPTELAGSRRRFREWLEKRALAHVADDVLLTVGEALTNAIDHGSADETAVVRVEATVDDERLMVSVSDSGQWQPGVEGLFMGRGRGHLLMQALAENVHVDTDQHGTIVTLTFAREGQLTTR